ncbi:unnamed protein product [Paramecium octaurelia]|uniref:Uncharacterized protein n=1 Tax=Paramecium octaurelia TaxID=43137 RepID=A0A8S1VJ42_PAROT|nr:unnamed protein product [Paramecium octaurelia]
MNDYKIYQIFDPIINKLRCGFQWGKLLQSPKTSKEKTDKYHPSPQDQAINIIRKLYKFKIKIKNILLQFIINIYYSIQYIKERLQQSLKVQNYYYQSDVIIVLKYYPYFENQYEEKNQSGKITQDPSHCIIRLIEHGVFINKYNSKSYIKLAPTKIFSSNFGNQSFHQNEQFQQLQTLYIFQYFKLMQITIITFCQLHPCKFKHVKQFPWATLTILFFSNQTLRYYKNVNIQINTQVQNSILNMQKNYQIKLLEVYPKDDLESLFYILIQLLSKGEFFNQSKKYKTRVENYSGIFRPKVNFLNPFDLPINYDSLRAVFKGCKNLNLGNQFSLKIVFFNKWIKKQSGNSSQKLEMQNED